MKITAFIEISTGKICPLNPETGRYQNLIKGGELNGKPYFEYTLDCMLCNTPENYMIYSIQDDEGREYDVYKTPN